MTGLAARTFGFKDRGIVKEGAMADLVVFDPLKIRDKATFESPKEKAEGIEYVLVNGKVAWEKGQPTEARSGEWITRDQSKDALKARI